jgi:nucleolar protein 56
MKAYVATNFVGAFAFDKEGGIIGYKLFPREVELIAERLAKVRKGEIIEEEKELVKKLIKSGAKEIVWDKKVKLSKVKCTYDPDNFAVKKLRNEFRDVAIRLNFVRNQSELNSILTKVNIILTGRELKKEKKDRVIMKVIGIIDQLDSSLNNLSERLREWSGLYFPELSKEIKSHEKFAEIISKRKASKESSGMEFSEKDLESLRNFSKSLYDLYRTREKLSKYLEGLSKATIPNLSSIAGPLLAARLLSLAGGLEKMVKMPSSKIQLLGAEKALFRHLRGEGKPPKYGIIFSHPYVQQAPKHMKGKVARLIASKLSLAARIDHFSGKDQGGKLSKDLEKKVKNLLKN